MPNIATKQVFESIAEENNSYKGILSNSGWLYLINDTNDFFRIFYGIDSWSEEDERLAISALTQRASAMSSMSLPYLKFIVPEKPAVYPEHLPAIMQSFPINNRRPATILAQEFPDNVYYLLPFLASVKSLGQLYFRGDTHPNWIGAWLIYRAIMSRLVQDGLMSEDKILDIKDLAPTLVGYDGDLVPHLSPEARSQLAGRLGFVIPAEGLEWTVKLEIPPERRCAARVQTPEAYDKWYNSRETFVFERSDRLGPKVVFFRDSTFDRGLMEMLAEHCSRSVFVWHLGQVDKDIIEIETPDFVVHCMAERFVTQYPSFPPLYQARKHFESLDAR